MSDPDPLALDRQVCFALAATSRSVIGLYRPVLEPLGLTHPQYLVMLALWERSPRTARSIADALHLEPPTLTPLLKRLEAVGYLTRARNPANERELAVELTERGRALRARAEQVPAQIVERLGVPLEVLQEVRDRLTDLLAASKAASDAVPTA
jgi:DNA-binding MarR family transcriptional regulator